MTQPPVRFENYPPDGSATPADSADEQTPVVRPYLPATIPAPPGEGSSRRTVIGLVIAIPLAGILFSAMGEDQGTSDDPGTYLPDDSDNEYTDGISVGSYSAPVPEGWSVIDGGDGLVEVTNGANRLTAVSIETATSSLAVEEIAHLANGRFAGFSGKVGDPVDRSSAVLQHATMDGIGTFRGEAARLMVELWIDPEGSGLLIARVLTAKAASTISTQAQEMLEALSGDF